MKKKFYEQYFQNYSLATILYDIGIRIRRKYVTSNIKKNYDKLLDLGCGIETSFLNTKNNKTIRMDYALNTLLTAQKLSKQQLTLINGDALKLPFLDNSFDTIVSQNVLEHIKNDQQVINEIYRILKPGGIAIISVPAGLLENLSEKEKKITPDHFRKYTHNRWKNLTKNLFSIEDIKFSQKAINLLWPFFIKIFACSHSIYKKLFFIKTKKTYYEWKLYKILIPILEYCFWKLDNLLAKQESFLAIQNYSICVILKKAKNLPYFSPTKQKIGNIISTAKF